MATVVPSYGVANAARSQSWHSSASHAFPERAPASPGVYHRSCANRNWPPETPFPGPRAMLRAWHRGRRGRTQRIEIGPERGTYKSHALQDHDLAFKPDQPQPRAGLAQPGVGGIEVEHVVLMVAGQETTGLASPAGGKSRESEVRVLQLGPDLVGAMSPATQAHPRRHRLWHEVGMRLKVQIGQQFESSWLAPMPVRARNRLAHPPMGAVLLKAAVPQGVDVYRRHRKRQLAQYESSAMPVTPTKCRGKTVSRLESATTRPAVKNWFTVRTTRRRRPRVDKAWSIKPNGRPLKLTSKCLAAQKRLMSAARWPRDGRCASHRRIRRRTVVAARTTPLADLRACGQVGQHRRKIPDCQIDDLVVEQFARITCGQGHDAQRHPGASVSMMSTIRGINSAAVASAIASTNVSCASAGTKRSGASDCCS